MARTKAGLSPGARLADFLSASLMARVVPPEVIHEVLDVHGRNSRRIRAFPAVAGVYYVMALSLYPEASYEAVFSAVSQGLAWEAGAPQPAGVSKVAISLLRSRIGAQPLADLVQRCCVPLAEFSTHPAAFYRGLRLVGIDGSTFELPDEPQIEQAFGRPEGRQGRAGYPQARCVVLAECASHAVIGANLGAYSSGEWALCVPLLQRLQPDMLCLADRGFNGFEHWEQASATGAQLLWRCASTRTLPVERALDDGSYLSTIRPGGVSVAQARARAITARDRLRPAQHARCAASLSADHDAAGPEDGAGDGAGRGVSPALGDRGRLRRAQDAPVAEPTGAAQSDAGARAAGVLRLGTDALHGAVAATPGRGEAPDTARGLVLHQACADGATGTAPVRGLSPQSVREDASAGSRDCLMPAPAYVPAGPSTGSRHAWSSDETRGTAHFSGARRAACRPTARLSRRRRCRRPRRGVRGCHARGQRAILAARLSSNLTVLKPNLIRT